MARQQNVIWTAFGILGFVAMFFYAISEQRWSEKPAKIHYQWTPTADQKKAERFRHMHHPHPPHPPHPARHH